MARFNFTNVHKKGRENSNTDAMSRSTHNGGPPPLEEDNYANFYEEDKPVISIADRVNMISYAQPSTA